MGEAEEIYIDEKPNAISQQMLLADDYKHKEKLLVALLQKSTFEKVIIFTNTKLKASQLDNLLRKVQDDPSLLLRRKMAIEYQKRRYDQPPAGVVEEW